MSGMIRLRPTQILLTSEEVNKAFHKSCPTNPKAPLPSGTLSWDYNITVRRNKNNKTVQNFMIHEDQPTGNREVESGEISEMSDFSFGPTLSRRGLSDRKTLFIGSNGSSEAGDEGNDDDERSSESTWGERHSVTTLTNDYSASGNFIPSGLIDGSISSTDEQQDLGRMANSDGPIGHEPNGGQGENFIDIEYMADIELSVLGDSESSAQDSDPENPNQESYSLPMDGASEQSISQKLEDMNIFASPVAPPRDLDDAPFRSRESFINGSPGTPDTPGGVSLPPTPPSVRRLLEEVSPGLDDVGGLSPRHVAVSRARLARYRSRSHQYSALVGQTPEAQAGSSHHQRSYTSGAFQQLPFSSSPPPARIGRRVIAAGAQSTTGEPYDTNTDDSDGGIGILGQDAGIEKVFNGGREDGTDSMNRRKEDAARRLFG